MRRSMLFAGLLGSFFCLTAQSPAPITKGPEGLWLTENHRSVIELYQCAQDKTLLCGRIHWIIKDGMQFDTKNPNKNMHTTPLCGMTIVKNLHPTNPPAEWDDGLVYKADEGNNYDADLDMLSNDSLKIHGYLGVAFLGKSQIWQRVSNKDYPRCAAPKAP